jgi:ketosteroid isomerase-like protein
MTRRDQNKQIFKPIFWACLPLVLFLSACGSQTPPDTRAADESTIKNLDAQWSKAAASNDVQATISYYADNASLLPPNAPIADSGPAIQAVWESLLGPGKSVSWQLTKVQVSRSGDLAYAMGVYQVSSKDSRDNSAEDHGKYVEVWNKQADGKWKAVADIFNSDMPAAAPAPKAKAKPSHHRTHAKHRTKRR